MLGVMERVEVQITHYAKMKQRHLSQIRNVYGVYPDVMDN